MRPRDCLSGCVFLAISALSVHAAAGEGASCVSDAACGEGYECELAPVAPDSPAADGDGGGSDAADPMPPQGVCKRIPLSCVDDADCPANYSCEVAGGSGDVACSSSDGCTEELVAEERICEAQLMACSSAADCPADSQCKAGVCAYDLQSCTAESDCAAGFTCIATGTSGSCESAPCAPGEACEPDVVCDEEEMGLCLPVPEACSVDADCGAGALCFDVPGDGELEGYPDFSCWPEGLVGAVEGTVEPMLDGEFVSAGSDDDADGAGPSGLGGQDETSGVGESGEPAAKDSSDDTGSSGASDGGGCSVAAHGSGPRGLAGLGVAALGLLAASRRRRR